MRGFALLLTDGAPQQDEEEPDGVENVVGRNPEDELEIEGVELGDQKENDDTDDGDPPLKTGQRVPGELNPAVRRKLSKESLDFPSKGWNLVESSPVVGLHAEIPTRVRVVLGRYTEYLVLTKPNLRV